ncbi:MAG: T9SS type A sorting domain-containing protein, partial [Muribaculaceae bacterium]|nr:T9SS type A sorting domain-containing protein [Muribaculaceae bacterium]
YGDLEQPQVFDLNNTSGVANVMASTSITITPTVVTDVVTVASGDLLTEVCVYTLDGKRTDRIAPQDNRATLSLNHLPAGVYFVEARNATGSRIVQQIVKRDL